MTEPAANDPLAPFRALADRYASEAAEQDLNVAASTIDEVRPVQWGIAAGWRHAEGLLRHTLNGLDEADDPAASSQAAAAPDPYRLLLDQFTANAVQAARAERADRHDETRQAHHTVAAGWTQAAHLLHQTIKQADNSQTTPDNPTASDNGSCSAPAAETEPNTSADLRKRYAEAIRWNMQFGLENAEFDSGPDSIQRINEWVDWIAKTLTAIRDDELEELRARIVTLEHVAAGNKRHVQLIVPDLERAEATLDRVRALAADMRTWCSPHNLAVDYADRIDQAIKEPEEDPS
ncbi:hypothetical protein AB0451_03365 [Streptomyces sp. NPDC052000]|uniref:hypothetical protein n=1 Tax=Streptomyces sp. NPDC052000 TaxID=3155676 RepID=UPI00344F0DCC